LKKRSKKTFAPAPSSPGAWLLQPARSPPDKRFAVLFVKKEHPFSLYRAAVDFSAWAPNIAAAPTL
jgi:hypothetical protein